MDVDRFETLIGFRKNFMHGSQKLVSEVDEVVEQVIILVVFSVWRHSVSPG